MKPRHEHDCDHCHFLGGDETFDYYYCDGKYEKTLIARYGVEGQYISGLSFFGQSAPITQAGLLAYRQKLISINVLVDQVKRYGRQQKIISQITIK